MLAPLSWPPLLNCKKKKKEKKKTLFNFPPTCCFTIPENNKAKATIKPVGSLYAPQGNNEAATRQIDSRAAIRCSRLADSAALCVGQRSPRAAAADPPVIIFNSCADTFPAISLRQAHPSAVRRRRRHLGLQKLRNRHTHTHTESGGVTGGQESVLPLIMQPLFLVNRRPVFMNILYLISSSFL